jgi:mono/diheme cytochrome c family protein
MTSKKPTRVKRLLLGFLPLALGACQSESPVSFAADVKPVLDQYCLECHQPGGRGFEASGFSMATYADMLKGADNGPMIVPGDSLGSNLVVLMEGRADPSIKMPHGSTDKVAQYQIEKIKAWIDQGAKDN